VDFQWDYNKIHPMIQLWLNASVGYRWQQYCDATQNLWWGQLDNVGIIWYESPWGYLRSFIEHPRAQRLLSLLAASDTFTLFGVLASSLLVPSSQLEARIEQILPSVPKHIVVVQVAQSRCNHADGL